MHVVILGCGRVGVLLARGLEASGHTVAVIDQDAGSFERLGDAFKGQTITGVGFDRDTLSEAGCDRAQAFAAVSSGDNSNIIAARVARETFGVERVVARIYDPRRADVYERLGIPTVRTVRWTADQVLRLIDPPESVDEFTDASGTVALALVSLHKGWVGYQLRSLEDAAGVRVGYLTRRGDGILPERGTVVQDGDLVHVLLRRDLRQQVIATLGSAPEGVA